VDHFHIVLVPAYGIIDANVIFHCPFSPMINDKRGTYVYNVYIERNRVYH
jgi:hypothetical protein